MINVSLFFVAVLSVDMFVSRVMLV